MALSGEGRTKESDLIAAALLYAIRSDIEGDLPVLREMNFGPKELAALRALTIEELQRFGALHVHCLRITLDRDLFWPLLAHVRRELANDAVRRQLLEADAPLDMMTSLFGMGAREYTRMRRLVTTAPAIGRPPEIDDRISHALWHAWTARRKASPSGALVPGDYLALAEESGASIRAIWQLTRRWLEEQASAFAPTGRQAVSMASDR